MNIYLQYYSSIYTSFCLLGLSWKNYMTLSRTWLNRVLKLSWVKRDAVSRPVAEGRLTGSIIRQSVTMDREWLDLDIKEKNWIHNRPPASVRRRIGARSVMEKKYDSTSAIPLLPVSIRLAILGPAFKKIHRKNISELVCSKLILKIIYWISQIAIHSCVIYWNYQLV
jgi:hypothetical protein